MEKEVVVAGPDSRGGDRSQRLSVAPMALCRMMTRCQSSPWTV